MRTWLVLRVAAAAALVVAADTVARGQQAMSAGLPLKKPRVVVMTDIGGDLRGQAEGEGLLPSPLWEQRGTPALRRNVSSRDKVPSRSRGRLDGQVAHENGRA